VEWVETTARTVEEAVDLALDQLGVDEQDAEWEVLEEPRPGLFGRVRGQARIRARIQPKAQPSKNDRRDRRRAKGKVDGPRRSERTAPVTGGGEPPAAPAQAPRDEDQDEATPAQGSGTSSREHDVAPQDEASVDEVADHVQGFLDGLVRAFGESAPVVVDRSDDEVVGRVDAKLGLLIGPKGLTLEAIQELTRVTAQRSAPSEIRIKVDVGSYRAQRQAALERFAREVAGKVRESGKSVALEPMPAADRKIVHDALSSEDGVVTSSDGTEPRRRVVVAPGDGA
jgi:spoIIIJ-associated protein